MTLEQRIKLAGELTIQRRLHEHSRDRAKRELEHANRELARLDDEFMRYIIREEEPASAIDARQSQDGETRLGPKGESK